MTTVLLVDDQQLVRSGFSLILSVEDDITVVGEAADGAEAVRLAHDLRPDVVLMDVQMPVMDGIAATSRIVEDGLSKVVILTTFDRDDYVFAGLAAGASGFLLKNADAEHLIEAVRAVAGGHALLAPEVTRRVIEQMTADATLQPRAGMPRWQAAARRCRRGPRRTAYASGRAARGAHATRARGARSRRPWTVERRDRGAALPRRGDRQDPPFERAAQARPP